MKLRIRTYPHVEGDRTEVLEVTRPEQVFTPGHLVVVDGQQVTDWDQLLGLCSGPDVKTVERFVL